MTVLDSNTSLKPQCFVIMPFSDVPDYAPGHFDRVYEHLIRPACEAAGYTPQRADDVSRTSLIIMDVLRDTINSPMVLCDMSAKNANVFYELGIRQAFDRPVALIHDSKTERIFDTSGLRAYEYDVSLRIDAVKDGITNIAEMLKQTAVPRKDEINSLVRLLGITPAKLPDHVELSQEETVVLSALRDIAERLAKIESQSRFPSYIPMRRSSSHVLPQGWMYDDEERSKPVITSRGGKIYTIISSDKTAPPKMVLLDDEDIEILRAVAGGLSDSAIGKSRGLSANGVKTRIERLAKLLGASTRPELTQLVRHNGILPS